MNALPFQLEFEPIWPWPVVLLAAGAMLTVVWRTYRQRLEPLAPGAQRILLWLRLLAVAALVFAMLRPEIHIADDDERETGFVIIGDVSRSMGVGDGPGGRTRREALVETLEEVRPQLDALKGRIDVVYYDAASELLAVDDPSTEATGEQSALGAILESLLQENRNRRIVGVLLLSDGAQRAVAPLDVDPRLVARLLAEAQIPVHTIGFGTTSLSGASLDLAVEDLLVDPLVFEKKSVPVSARIRTVGAAGRPLTVRLLIEDRTGKRIGEAGEMVPMPLGASATPVTTITPTRDAEVLPVELSFVPQAGGEYKIALEVEPLDGELLTRNNRRETIITVRQGGVTVAYFDRIRPEQKFVREVNDSDKIQLDFKVVLPAAAGVSTTAIDPEWLQPGKYNVYIIGDVAASSLGPKVLSELAARVDEGAGLLMTGGFQSFGAGGYASTPLASALPVAMHSAEREPDGRPNPQLHLLDSLRMVPTALGLQRFVMRLDAPERNRERWMNLPELTGGNRLRPKNPAVEVWATTEDSATPLLLAHEYGRARVMALAVDTTFQWWLGGDEDAHRRFWRQAVLWLARKELDGDQPVWARVDPRNFAPGQAARIEFGAQTEEGVPIDDASFRVSVLSPGGERAELAPQQIGPDHFADFVGTENPGDYWVEVEATHEGTSVGFPAQTRFIVDSRDLELDNPAADLALLQELSSVTGGSALPPEELQAFLQRLLDRDALSRFTTVRNVRLWDNGWLLGVFVGLMVVEWWYRKRRGLV